MPTRRLAESPAACAVAWIVALGPLAAFLALTPDSWIRGTLIELHFWWLDGLFAFLIVTTALAAPALWRHVRARADLRVLLCWSLAGLALSAFAAPRIPRMFYDEQIYQNVGQNLADLRKAQFCNEGVVEYGRLDCIRGEYNKEPYGWPHALSVGYRIAGVHEWVAHTFNNLAVAALVWAAALIAILLADDPRAAVGAAAVAALVPQVLRWGNTGAAEPIATAAAAWAVASAAWFVRARTSAALAWMVGLSAFAIQVRPESLLVVPIVAIIVALFARDEIARVRTWWWTLAGVVLSAMFVAHMFAVRHENWQSTGPRFSLEYFRQNFPTNAGFFVVDERFPVVYTLLALAGLATIDRRAGAALLAWFAAFWAVFVGFYAGSYDWGANVRYSVMVAPPMAVLAGAGIAALSRRIERRMPRVRVATRLVVAAVVFQFLWYMPQVRDVGEESWAARADVRFAREFAGQIPPDSIVLTQNPNMFLLWGRNAAQISLATTEETYVRNHMLSRYSGGVFVHWNFWCNIPDKVQQEFCQNAIQRFDADVVAERRERDFRFVLYRLR